MLCTVCGKKSPTGQRYTLYFGNQKKELIIDEINQKIYNRKYYLKKEDGFICTACLSQYFIRMMKTGLLASLIPPFVFLLLLLGIYSESRQPFSILNPLNLIVLVSLLPFLFFTILSILKLPRLYNIDESAVTWMANFLTRDWLHESSPNYDACAKALRSADLIKQDYKEVLTRKEFEHLKQSGLEIKSA